jgi:hypothetical protein
MSRFSIDRRPNRIVSLYVPAALALLSGLLLRPMCICPVAELIAYQIVSAVIVFGVSWLLVRVGFYGYHFLRALFHDPR